MLVQYSELAQPPSERVGKKPSSLRHLHHQGALKHMHVASQAALTSQGVVQREAHPN